MKVLLVVKYLDRSEVDLALYLKQAGVNIHVLTSSDSAGREQLEAEGIYIPARPYNSKISPAFIRQIRQLVDSEKFNLIHATDSQSLANVIWATYFRSVKIVGYRGTLAKVRRTDPSYWLALLHPKVDRIICVNQSIYDYMLTFFPAKKLSLNYKGYELEWAKEANNHPVELPALPDQAFVVCYIATTQGRPHKGLKVLVQAMHLLAGKNIHLLFIGNYDNDVKNLAEQGEAAKQIHFLGMRKLAASYLRYCQVFVLPSLRDGLPRAMKEAMAEGVAVITTRIPGPSELVIDGESGLWVEPGRPDEIAQAITRLYQQPELRKRLGEAGKQRLLKQFSSDTFHKNTLGLYQELFSNQGEN